MSEGEKVFSAIIVLAMCLISGVACYAIHGYRAERQTAIENGYSEQSIVGQSGTYWVKDGKPMGEKQ